MITDVLKMFIQRTVYNCICCYELSTVVHVWETIYDQLLDKAERDKVEFYCYRPKPKVLADNTNRLES